VSPADLRHAIRQANVFGLLLDQGSTPDGTRSELEFCFLELCQRWGLPSPAVNVHIGSRIVDFVWPKYRLVVETDGYRYHRGRFAFEDDRARDLELRTQGYDIVRLTYRQVMDSPDAVAAVLRPLLTDEGSRVRR
jgi:hypothetical protein